MSDTQSLFKVTQAKGLISLQACTDLIRQHLGFSASGAADEYAFLSANKILGNDSEAHAIELCFAQFGFVAQHNCLITFTGANCRPQVNDQNVNMWQTLELNIGDRVTTNFASNGNYSYLGIRGGFSAPKRFASSQLEHLAPALISKLLTLSNDAKYAPENKSKTVAQYAQFYADKEITLRFMPHPIWHQLSKSQQTHFLSDTFRIEGSSNKMGVRVSGNGLKLNNVNNLLSKPVCYGAIQLPSDGQPIVLMKDRQTIGGYPTLGAVIQVDLFRLAQLQTGNKIRFVPISVEQAQSQLTSFYQKFK